VSGYLSDAHDEGHGPVAAGPTIVQDGRGDWYGAW
jgi:hypothetical protein